MREFLSPRQKSVPKMAPTPPPVKDDKLSAIMARRRQMADAQPPASPNGSVMSATASVKSKPKDEDGGGGAGGNGSDHMRSDLYEAMMKRRTMAQNGTVHQSPRQKISAEKFKHVKLDSSLQDKLKHRLSLEERSLSRRSQVSNESGTHADDEGGQKSSGNLSTESFGSSPPSYASVAERSTFSNKSAPRSYASSQREGSRSGRSISDRSNESDSDRARHRGYESQEDQATQDDDAAVYTSDDNDAPFPEHDNSNSVDNDPFESSGEDGPTDDDVHVHTDDDDDDDDHANAYTSGDNVYPTRGTVKAYNSESEYEEVTVVSSRNSPSQRGDSSWKQASFETLGTLGGGGGTTTDADNDDPFDRDRESVPRDNSFFGTHSVTSRDEELTRITEEHDEMQQHVDDEQATLESYEEQTVSDHPTTRSARGERSLYDDVTVEEEAGSGTGSTRHSRKVEEHESSYETDDAADDDHDAHDQTPYGDDNDYDDGYNDNDDYPHTDNDHETDDEHNNYASDDQYDDNDYDHMDSSGEQEPLYELDTTGFSQGAQSTDGWSVDHNEGVEVTEESSRERTRSFGGSCDGDRSILSGLSVLEAVLEEDSVVEAGEDSKGAAYDGVFGGKIVDGKIDRDIPMGSEDSVLNETMALTSDDANNESRDHSEQALPRDVKKRNSFWCSWPCIVCTVLFCSVGVGVGLGMLFWQQSDSKGSSESGERQPGNIFAPAATPTEATPMAPSRVPISPDLSPDVSSAYTLLCSKLTDCNGLLDILTPRGMAFDWLVNNKEANPDLTAQSEYTKVQRYALATLYYSTGGDTWSNKTNWLSNLDACQWWSGSGSGCGVFSNNITILDLDDNNVQGVLPNDLGLLTSLTAISIRNPTSSTPDIGGSLPSSLGLLTSLTSLVLTGNLFSGNVPTELSSCTMLESVDLGNNNLNGGIPTSFASLSKLSMLNLEGNYLAGEPDPTIFEGITGLVDLNLQGNRLTSIPTSIMRLTQLQNLNLGSNLLSTFPLSVTEIGSLSHLSLEGNMFAGPVPVQIGRLTSLRYLDLSGSSFSGSIPVEIGRLTLLSETLDLSDNALTGSIPSVLGQLRELKQLKLNGNRFAGQLPSELALLSKIEELRIEDNTVTGTVPTDLCTLLNSDGAAASYADCDELALPPCFTFCCTDGEDCVCRFEMEDPFRCVKRESS
jgi:Leucine-rich repeat (LRR) protein